MRMQVKVHEARTSQNKINKRSKAGGDTTETSN